MSTAGRRLSQVGDSVDAHPWLTTAGMSLLGLLMAGRWSDNPADFELFANAGGEVLRGHLSQTFADVSVQTGPLTAVAMAVLRLGTGWAGARGPALVILALCWVNAACLVTALRHSVAKPGAGRGVLLLLAGLFAVAYGAVTLTDAHPTHAVIPLLWFFAVRAARRDRPEVVGLLIGVGCGLDTWAALGFGAVLALPAAGRMLRACLVTGLTTGAIWLPFVAAGPVNSFRMQWLPSQDSVPWLLFGASPVPWSYRLAQGLCAASVGAAVVWRLRHSDDAAWLLPAAVVSVRVALDPVWFEYYGIPVTIFLLVGMATLAAGWRSHVSVPLVPLVPLVVQQLKQRARRPRQTLLSPMLWAAMALLLPPVAALLGGPLTSYAPSIASLAILSLLLSTRSRWSGSCDRPALHSYDVGPYRSTRTEVAGTPRFTSSWEAASANDAEPQT